MPYKYVVSLSKFPLSLAVKIPTLASFPLLSKYLLPSVTAGTLRLEITCNVLYSLIELGVMISRLKWNSRIF